MMRAWLIAGAGVLWLGCSDDESSDEGTGGRTTGGTSTGGRATGGTSTGGRATGGNTTGGNTTGGGETTGAAGASGAGAAGDGGARGGAPEQGDCSSAMDEGSCEARGCLPVIGTVVQLSNGGAAGQGPTCELTRNEVFAGCAIGAGGAINICACKDDTCVVAPSGMKYTDGWDEWEESSQCTECL